MRIVILDGSAANPGDLSWTPIAQLGELVVHDFTQPEQTIPRLQGAQVALTNKTDQAVRDGEWARANQFCFWKAPLVELAGKTMGLVGYGNIGSAVARIALAFGMQVLACTPHPEKAASLSGVAFASLDEVLAQSDVVSLHCPLFPSTEGIINKDTIAKMKDGVKIINTSRGPLIVEEDLKEGLNSGKVSGAAVDVVSTEPIREDNPLLGAKNMIITPHIAWAPRESRQRLMDIAVDNLRQFVDGKPQNVVNR